jgi:hypothetical protein
MIKIFRGQHDYVIQNSQRAICTSSFSIDRLFESSDPLDYASQFFEQAAEDLGDLHAQFAAGEFEPLRNWLQEKIHRVGQCVPAADLVQQVTGQPLSHDALMRHLRGTLRPLYGLE